MGKKGRQKRDQRHNSTQKIDGWYLSECNRGEQLLVAGKPDQAFEVFNGILAKLPGGPRYERAVIIGRLGYCEYLKGKPDRASTLFREALDTTAQLAPSQAVKGLSGMLHAELGGVLYSTGQYAEARIAFEAALAITQELQDLRGQGIYQSQLGALTLAEGRPEEALKHYQSALGLFQAIPEPALEAIAWQQLGRIFHAQRRWNEAEHHYLEAAKIREGMGDLAGGAQLWCQLALLNQEAGRLPAAEAWYRKSIDWIKETKDPVQLGRSLSRLAALLPDQPGLLSEARHLAEQALAAAEQTASTVAADSWAIFSVLADMVERELAATTDGPQRILLQTQASQYRQLSHFAPQFVTALGSLGDEAALPKAVLLGRLGLCFSMTGQLKPAVASLQEALATTDKLEGTEEAKGLNGMLHTELGDAFRAAGQYAEARKAYEAALTIAQELGDIRGEGVDQGQLGALALAEGKRDEALMHYEAALKLFQAIPEPSLEAVARHQLGRIFHSERRWDEAERHYREAAKLLEGAGDVAGASQLSRQLSLLNQEAGRLETTDTANSPATNLQSAGPGHLQPVEIKIHELFVTEYVLEPNLLLDGPRHFRITPWAQQSQPLSDGLRPMLIPCTRTYVDDDGAIRFAPPEGEPKTESRPGYTIMRRLRREVSVSADHGLIWRLVRRTDGSHTVAEILAGLSTTEHALAAQLLADLSATGVVDISGRPIARFLHSATKKGTLPAGGLKGDEVEKLATDSNYRAYPEVPQIALDQVVPRRLRDFHTLTRTRRSRRDYEGSLTRVELEALLYTACGVTGVMPGGGPDAKLRAYPSSGALYAVEVYPLVLRVEDLDPAVYHYRAIDNLLELVKPVDESAIIGAMLPMERQMVAGAAAMICLTGNFPRHERKYGEGGYRMLIAEAGHISQTLILAATALGLAARPFGGVFDGLLNKELGLEMPEEEFLLAVLVGRGGG